MPEIPDWTHSSSRLHAGPSEGLAVVVSLERAAGVSKSLRENRNRASQERRHEILKPKPQLIEVEFAKLESPKEEIPLNVSGPLASSFDPRQLWSAARASLLTASILITSAPGQGSQASSENQVPVAKALSEIRQDRDFIAQRATHWKALYDNLSGHCAQTLIRAVQQRHGGARAIDLVKTSLWAQLVCGAADGAFLGFFTGSADALTSSAAELNGLDFVEPGKLNDIKTKMDRWKDQERELNNLMTRLVGATADHSVCYENHDSADPECAPSSRAIDTDQTAMEKFAKYSFIGTVQDVPKPLEIGIPVQSPVRIDAHAFSIATYPTTPGHRYRLTFTAEGRESSSSLLIVAVGARSEADQADKKSPSKTFGADQAVDLSPRRIWAAKTFEFTAEDLTTQFRLTACDPDNSCGPPTKIADILVADLSEQSKVSQRVLSLFVQQKPTRIWLQPDKASETVGRPIYLRIVLASANGLGVVADRDYDILLKATGGEVRPKELTIRKGEQSAPAEIRSSTPAQETVQASTSTGVLLPGQTATAHCGHGAVEDLVFVKGQEQGPADNQTEIRFALDLTDKNGTPVSDNTEKSLGFNLSGVGRMLLKDNRVRGGECRTEQSIVSSRVGTATITATLGVASRRVQNFSFFVPPLTSAIVAFAIFGGLAGAFVRAAMIWHKSKHWRWRTWIISFFSGGLTGLCLFLAYYFGLSWIPAVPGFGAGLSFVIGMFGGYLGPTAIDKMSSGVSLAEPNLPAVQNRQRDGARRKSSSC